MIYYEKYNEYIIKEYEEFKSYHQNKYNLIMHILSGILYMGSLNVLTNGNVLPYYLFFLLFTHERISSLSSFLYIKVGSTILMFCNLSTNALICTFLLGGFIFPEISHYVTNEKTLLNMQNATPKKLATNIIYFLPFSIQCLMKN